MNLKFNLNKEESILMDLNRFTIKESSKNDAVYRIKHIQYVKRYALLLNKRLNYGISNRKIIYAALSHDILKERYLNHDRKDVIWNGIEIPQDTTRYVRTNLDILEKFGLDDYFNTDIQYHALSAGIFIYKELKITDPEILYPIFFHSCPIIDIYDTLNYKIRNFVDIIMLSDKLSSNRIKIELGLDVRTDLDLVVFGYNGCELNYNLGLYLARLISQGKSTEEQSMLSTKYYYERLCNSNPLIKSMNKDFYDINLIGDKKEWPKRKSQALMMH